MKPRHVTLALLLAASFALSGCDSAKDRAQKHYLAGMELLKQGDVDRAMIEFRNVFQLDGTNHDARATYAGLLRKRGNLQEAYGQYLRLVEQYPDDLDGNRALAELALNTGNLDDANRFAAATLALAPQDPAAQAVTITLQYRAALRSADDAARKVAAAKAAALIATAPETTLARQIVIDDQVRAKDWPEALAQIDAGLAADPQERSYYPLRIGVLSQLGDNPAIEAQLRNMLTVFPNDATIAPTLVRWYVSQKNLDAAESFLRSRIDPAKPDTAPRLALLQFLTAERGRTTAKAELDQMIASARPEDRSTYQALHAAYVFEDGNHAAAIAELAALVKDAPPSIAVNEMKVALARMLAADGQMPRAHATVAEILSNDPNQVEAMKLKAGWLIDEDKTGDAQVLLRSALGQAPRDPELMTLMARAYDRDGSRDLAADMLSQAVDASDHAPDTSLRYASLLVQDQKLQAAESVLRDAQRVAPDNLAILSMLGRVHVTQQDWLHCAQDIAALRALASPEATSVADDLEAQQLQAQSHSDDLIAFLNGLSKTGPSGVAVDIAIIRTNVARGDLPAALKHSEDLLARLPDDPSAQLVHATVLGAMGQVDQEIPLLRAMITRNPKLEAVWTELYRASLRSGGAKAGAAVLTEALAALPDDANLQWAQAAMLERSGNIDGAIAIYEALYAHNSDSPVVANNLASLLASNRSDDASLQRAFTIARRLRGSPIPAFQDTYGWISYRLGNYDAALSNLKPAALGLPKDASVQYHLAMTYAALHDTANALRQFQAASALIDPTNPPPFKADMDAHIGQLTPATPAPNN